VVPARVLSQLFVAALALLDVQCRRLLRGQRRRDKPAQHDHFRTVVRRNRPSGPKEVASRWLRAPVISIRTTGTHLPSSSTPATAAAGGLCAKATKTANSSGARGVTSII